MSALIATLIVAGVIVVLGLHSLWQEVAEYVNAKTAKAVQTVFLSGVFVLWLVLYFVIHYGVGG